MEILATHRCGQVAWNKGYVDFNIYNGSYYDLKKLTIGNQEDEW